MVEPRRRQTTGIARLGAGALLVLAIASTAGCSSSSGTDAAPAPTTSSTTAGTVPPGSAAPGTTAPATEPEPAPEIVAANVTAADLGAGWADYPEGAEVLGEEESGGCAEASGLLDDLPDEAFADGTIIQYGDRLVFAQTNARVFPSSADADAFAAHLLTEASIECRRDELERGLPEVEPPLAIASTGSATGDGTSPYVGSFSYETQQVVDGVAQPAGAASRHAIYVKGPVVIDLFTQIGYSEGDPADLGETTNTMIDEAMAAVLARVTA